MVRGLVGLMKAPSDLEAAERVRRLAERLAELRGKLRRARAPRMEKAALS